MTDKMSKEEAKIKLRTELRNMDVPPEETVEMGDLIGTTIDAIESEHKPVGLPKWLCDKLDRSETVMPFFALSAINFRANGDQSEWFKSLDNQRKTMRAFADGWVPEEEKLWNVFVPKAIKVPGHVSIYAKFKRGVQPVNTDGLISAGEYTFTKEELIKYGLDGDLFEKVLVKDTK